MNRAPFQWICHAQCSPFRTSSSLWFAMDREVLEKRIPIGRYGESPVESL